ncbi:sugar nucleotide-binding protein [Marinomonas sp. M1K-6]|uniref:dTDP-4-dehydrorhamnose reductase n=1 Tax=Marinomonas profundi TaxID=2726122 RepID=A0A847R887_9GAMM|nr:sugar nucleotide-binding protein [Marinomonas profundi]NLQ16480.1 sugar nucleotide-binding protein [Marinomonas profundi]UDV03930.1 sugar nucleotide-binding protein [Marinomonas profundi]
MSTIQNINAPIRILLLGSNTEIGSSLLQLSKDKQEFEWLCPEESLLLDANRRAELEAMSFNVIIDALSLRYALQNDYSAFQSTLQYFSEKAQAPLIMISSAQVFSGNKDVPYAETDTPDSSDAYALALIKSENIVLNNPDSIVLRTGWLFSGQGDDFVCRTLGLIKDGVNLAYKDDLIGSPTPVSDLVRVILSMINQGHYGAANTGVYHYCCAEEISWIGLVEAIVATSSQFDPKAQVEVEAISDSFPEVQDVVVMKRQSLSCRKIFNHFGIKQRPWRSKLRSLVKELYQAN